MRLAFVLFALLLLSGCISMVEVHTDGAPPQLSFWPGGVRVARGENDALTVSSKTVGLAYQCGAFGAGYSAIVCTTVDPRACGVAIVYPDKTTDEDLLGHISDRTRADCLHSKEGPQ